ncbi:DUF4177 domain-containing protein [Cyanobium sp. HWJ4-Hawea]|uniref:hypothetical protein n=1 Tax=Cyanobium sp. HWJ4-Hawea TaxID=2823713 RepID=UPI0020CD7C4E|nr:hypothetical protein [Cyanobium sp. HWJ4-Hawea]MCP9808634.1 DUF4177 domain-containing protein [Cyanobium sp. HWJ4-Hawea]
MNRLRARLRRNGRHTPQVEPWEYKVVQMVSQPAADPSDASRRLGGALSPEALRNQFPEHYGGVNGRQQISDFLNRLGEDHWELVQTQEIGGLPLMIFKRPKQLPSAAELAMERSEPQLNHAKQSN